MVSLLLVTHGDLAKALLDSAALIMGEPPLIESYGLYHGDDIDELKEKVKNAIIRLNEQSEGDGVLVLTDLFGGSPSNATARSFYELGDDAKTECITGVNLPMLLEAASNTSYMSLEELKKACLISGPQSIMSLRDKIQI
ncbi:MAG: PTS sugar transporter subunit IIA [Eubacteriales bacterium]|nr:PTS sugar transporter subunit IIA [Eubacteriales bacterium]